MNPQLLDQLANDRQSEIRTDAAERHLVATATTATTPRASIRERAGWTLIHAGLKLTGPPAPSSHGRQAGGAVRGVVPPGQHSPRAASL
jgi:hypothetical protein